MEEQNKEQEKEPKKKKSTLKIDGVVVLCVFLILLLIAIAVLPPMLRIMLPDRIEPAPIVTPPPSEETEEKDGILICTKEEATADLVSNYVEEYHYANDLVSYVEIKETKKIVPGGMTTKDALALACEERALNGSEISGVQVYCDATLEDEVTKTETIDYNSIDLYALEQASDKFEIDFSSTPLRGEVVDKKQQDGYSCD